MHPVLYKWACAWQTPRHNLNSDRNFVCYDFLFRLPRSSLIFLAQSPSSPSCPFTVLSRLYLCDLRLRIHCAGKVRGLRGDDEAGDGS